MHEDIKHYIQTCLAHQQATTNTALPSGLLRSLQIPKQIWEDLATDFIIGLPPPNAYSMIMVVFDGLEKYVHFSTLKTDYSNKQVAKNLYDNYIY